MNKFFYLILILMSTLGFSYRIIQVKDIICSQKLNYNQLSICYNYNNKIANYVTYYATSEQVSQSSKRKSFKPDPNIPDKYKAFLNDYHKSGKDRFHLCPSFIMDFDEIQLQYAFYLSNVVPGDFKINRYRWVLVEHQEKNFYLDHNMSDSIVGVIMPKHAKSETIGIHKIKIPEYFYKCFFDDNNISDNECYLMANDYNSTKDNNTSLYKLNIRQLEKFGIKIKIK